MIDRTQECLHPYDTSSSRFSLFSALRSCTFCLTFCKQLTLDPHWHRRRYFFPFLFFFLKAAKHEWNTKICITSILHNELKDRRMKRDTFCFPAVKIQFQIEMIEYLWQKRFWQKNRIEGYWWRWRRWWWWSNRNPNENMLKICNSIMNHSFGRCLRRIEMVKSL